MINGKSVLAVTLARGGSRRIPKKNIADINGKPLIRYTIDEVKKRIEMKEGVPRCRTRLIYAGLSLLDEKRVSDYNIAHKDEIYFVLAPKVPCTRKCCN